MKLNYKFILLLLITLTTLSSIALGIAWYTGRGLKFFLLLTLIFFVLLVLTVLFKQIIIAGLTAFFDAVEKVDALAVTKELLPETSSYQRWGWFLIIAILTAAGYFIFLSVTNFDQYYLLIVEEDGLGQSLSSLFWFLAMAVILVSFNRALKLKQNKPQIIYYLILTITAFLFFGEEISWGQRVFKLVTPDLLKGINVQEEINLHDIGSISIFSNAFFLLMFSFFFIVPYGLKRYPKIHNLFHHYEIPTVERFAVYAFTITFLVWIFIGIKFGTLGFHPFSFYPQKFDTQMDDEFFEFFSAISFFVFAFMGNLQRRR